MSVPSQYDDFAGDYDWIYSDRALTGEPYYEGLRPLLDRLPPDPRILDCACGTGIAALGLARHGMRVIGSDASEGMIVRAMENARAQHLDVPFEVCAWERLGERFKGEFDLVLCGGNAIGHCRDAEEMIRSLRGMRSVMKPGGRIEIESRNWEKVLAERVRFTSFGYRERDGTRCATLWVWTFPARPDGAFLIEAVFVFDGDSGVSVRHYPVTYHPFRLDELLERLRAAGLADLTTDYASQEDRYRVSATR